MSKRIDYFFDGVVILLTLTIVSMVIVSIVGAMSWIF